MLCFECLEEIGKQHVCPYCGAEMFPTVKEAKKILKNQKEIKRQKQKKDFSDEEILALRLYPKDEGYKMSLISKILGKK